MASRLKKTAHAEEQRRPDVLEQRRDWFASQLDLDPAKLVFVDETGAAFTHLNDYANGFAGDPEHSLRTGFELAQRVVEMDQDEPAGHLALGIAYSWRRDLDRAEAEARRGLALSPNSVELLILLANVQIFAGKPADALVTL